MRGRGRGVLAAAVVVAAVVGLAVPAAAATQPGRPTTGFGSTQGYVSTGATEHVTGSATTGSRVWWYVPTTLRDGATAPVVVFLHGFSLITPDPYRDHIDHLTRQGYIVVYPQFNLSLVGLLFDTNQNTMLSRAIEATDTALARLGSIADRSRVHLYGHSLGGLLASVWTARGGVAPASVTLANPSTGAGAPIPVTEVPWRTLAPQTTAPVIGLTGDDDTIAAPAESTGLVQVMTSARSRIVYQARTDTWGDPDLDADHMTPIDDDGIIPSWMMDFFGGDGEVDAYDHRFYRAALDAAIAGHRTVPFAMGQWSDGRAVLAPTVLFADVPTAPGAPTAVTATPGDGQVTVGWGPPATTGGRAVTGYRVYRDGLLVASPGPSATSFVDLGRSNGTAYAYTVTAVNVEGESAPAGPATATPRTVPGAPSGLAAVPGDGQVAVSWDAPTSDGGSPVTGYRIHRDGTLVAEVGADTRSVEDAGLTNGTSYGYTVTALTAGGESPPAGPVTAIPRTVPGAPTGLTVSPGPADTLQLSWMPPGDDGGSPVTGYRVHRDGELVAEPAEAGWTDPDPEVGVNHSYAVTAVNAAGESAAVGPVTGRVDHHQPDALVRRGADVAFVGQDVHNGDGTDQAVVARTRRGTKARFVVRVEDDGTTADTFTLRAPAGTNAFRTRYLDPATGADVTAAVVAGTHVLGAGGELRIEVRVAAGVTVGRSRSILVSATSAADGTAVDAVKATVRAVRT